MDLVDKNQPGPDSMDSPSENQTEPDLMAKPTPQQQLNQPGTAVNNISVDSETAKQLCQRKWS